MDIEILKTMIMLDKTKSFSKAAIAMNLSQPTVSSRISELEKELNKKIFERSKKGIKLTAPGCVFLPYAKKILESYEKGISQINSMKIFDDRIVIGNVNSAISNSMMPVYIDFIRSFPHISIKAIRDHSPKIIRDLNDGLIDIAISYQLPKNGHYSSWLCLDEDFILIAGRKHPLSKVPYLHVDELANMNLLMLNWGGDFTHWFYNIVPSNRFASCYMGNPHSLCLLVEENLGAAIVTRSSAQEFLEKESVVEIPLVGSHQPPRLKTYMSIDTRQISRDAVQKWIETMDKHHMLLTSV